MIREVHLAPIGALLLLTLSTQACSSEESAPPRMTSMSASAAKLSKADAKLRHDLAWVAIAAQRCTGANAGPSCTRDALATVSSIAPKSIQPKSFLSDIVANLPGKDVLCSVVQAAKGGGDSTKPTQTKPSSTDDKTSTTDDKTSKTTTASYAIAGARASLAGGGATTAEMLIATDPKLCRQAAFVHRKSGLGDLTKLTSGYQGRAFGMPGDLFGAWTGAFEANAGVTNGVKKVGADLTATLEAAKAPVDIPDLSATFLASLGKDEYVAWDEGTKKLVTIAMGGKAPTLAGSDGNKYVQFAADGEITCGQQVALAQLQEGGETEVDSPAGRSAALSVLDSVLKSLDLSPDQFCNGARDTNGDGVPDDNGVFGDGGTSGSSGIAAGSTCIFDPYTPNFCGGAGKMCSWNGDGYCCRTEPKGNTACPPNSSCPVGSICVTDSDCARGLVCAQRRGQEGEQTPFVGVCAVREPCAK